MSQRWVWAPTVGSLFLGILGSWWVQPQWDEAATLSAAQRSYDELWQLLGNIDAVHGLYYLLIQPLAHLDPNISLTVFRGISCLAIAVTVLAVSKLGARMVAPGFGILAGTVLALLPVTSYYAMDARTPALVAAAVAWASYLLVRILDAGSTARAWLWVGYAVLMVVACSLFVFAVLMVVAHLLAAAWWRDWHRWWGVALASLPALVAAAGVMLIAGGQSDQISWVTKPSFGELLRVPLSVVASGNLTGSAPNAPVVEVTIFVLTVLTGFVAAVGIGLTVWHLLKRSEHSRTHGNVIAVALPWAIVPAVILVAVSLLAEPVFVQRYVFFSTAGWALLVSVGLWLMRPHFLAIGIGTLALVMSLPAQWALRTPTAKDTLGDVVAVVDTHTRPGQAVAFVPASGRRITALEPELFAGLTDVNQKVTPIAAGDYLGEKISAEKALRNTDTDTLAIVMRDSSELPVPWKRALDRQGWTLEKEWRLGKQTVQLWSKVSNDNS